MHSEGAVGINATSFNGIVHFIYKAKSKNIKPILSFSMIIDNIKCLIISTDFFELFQLFRKYCLILDILGDVFKTIFFGFVIAYIFCYRGVYIKGRSTEIGKAITDSVAYSIMAIIVVNLVLSYMIFS